MQKKKYRHEYKHFVSVSDYLAISRRLSVIAKRDPYAGEDGRYRIRSLYFDNADNKALIEKLTGVDNREKFRLRIYNESDTYIKLEKKCKENGLCRKLSRRITREECDRLLSGDIGWMKASDSGLLMELYTKMYNQQLRPKTLVEYVREPFIYPPGNVRVTFDSQIRTGISSTELFSDAVPTIRSAPGTVIMEVKYDAFIPEIICDVLQTRDRRCSTFSKYAACRIYG
ncbi:polyphosphate polymerase domain-containing protein [Candidatus Soleaferrea massiliensis]|uniref:polyphosphate polymerase domain-containing protein n=1 Tax=Candidatus Soleaferrea massiliensis TaxID=1470354 RepID=UPI00058FD5A6|nr:polyphosphate polymerase domain-containing protein [Candidatus Soleaferrea massiliensis]